MPNYHYRDEIVPINSKNTISNVPGRGSPLSGEKSNANQGVTIEYVMLDHVNDGTEHAHQPAELIKRDALQD